MKKNKAYLEKNDGEWFDDFVYMSVEPLKALNFEIISFDGNNMEDTLLCYPLDIEKDVIFGSVQATSEFFKACGVEVPEYLGYPEELNPFLGRKIIQTTLGKANQIKMPFFIKPSKGVKKFTGCLIEKESQLDFLRDFDNVKDNEPIFLSESIEFISEYRCFVHEEELKGVQFYLGDFKVFPDIEVIESAIKKYKSANCAYTLDVGVTKGGCTWLVEVNDMWAIGSYGFNAKDYVLMCVRRMREIGRQAKGETESLWKRLRH